MTKSNEEKKRVESRSWEINEADDWDAMNQERSLFAGLKEQEG